MSTSRPESIALDPDEDYARYVGHTAVGRQFFLTTPFEPGGREFIALYLFDSSGRLIEARIDDLGPRATLDREARRALLDEWLRDLGPVERHRIKVAPFTIERFGLQFGFVPRAPEEDDEPWTVEAQPGSYMAFLEPWNSGEYDT
jgi:hypothetical protein